MPEDISGRRVRWQSWITPGLAPTYFLGNFLRHIAAIDDRSGGMVWSPASPDVRRRFYMCMMSGSPGPTRSIRLGIPGRGKGEPSHQVASLTPKPLASSVYVHVLEASPPLKRSLLEMSPFPFLLGQGQCGSKRRDSSSGDERVSGLVQMPIAGKQQEPGHGSRLGHDGDVDDRDVNPPVGDDLAEGAFAVLRSNKVPPAQPRGCRAWSRVASIP